jgi:hypothetical protein
MGFEATRARVHRQTHLGSCDLATVRLMGFGGLVSERAAARQSMQRSKLCMCVPKHTHSLACNRIILATNLWLKFWRWGFKLAALAAGRRRALARRPGGTLRIALQAPELASRWLHFLLLLFLRF